MTERTHSAVELSDEQLMARVAARDAVAFELLYDRYAPVVLGVVVKIVGDRAVGEEVLQDTYWRIWSQAASYDPAKGPLRPWLFSIARRLALDVLRRQSVRPVSYTHLDVYKRQRWCSIDIRALQFAQNG